MSMYVSVFCLKDSISVILGSEYFVICIAYKISRKIILDVAQTRKDITIKAQEPKL